MTQSVHCATESDRRVQHGPWRPGFFLWGQLALHGVALGILVFWWPLWPLAVTMVLLSHLMIMVSGLWPRSTWMGETMVRLPAQAAQRNEVAITIDDGPDPLVTPRVLEILACYGVQASFFCIGARAAQHPGLCRQIVAAGHRIENHGQRHPTLISIVGTKGWRREVLQGQQTLQSITGQAPLFYRAVAGLRNVFLAPVLHRAGLRLASWTRRGFDTRECNPQKVLGRLLHQVQAGDIFLLHDGNAALTKAGIPMIVLVLPALIEALRERGLKPVTLVSACTPR